MNLLQVFDSYKNVKEHNNNNVNTAKSYYSKSDNTKAYLIDLILVNFIIIISHNMWNLISGDLVTYFL